MSEEKIDAIRVRAILDTVCLIWDSWNRKEITDREALHRMHSYIRREIEGAKKRRELLRSSVKLEG